MHPPTSTELLQIWENGFDQTNLEKAFHLLATACSIPDLETIAQWSIGQRDGRLFQLRAWMFGGHFTNTAHCPKCDEQVEWEMNIADFPIPDLPQEMAINTFLFESEDYQINYRLPNSQDLMMGAPEKILDNCLLKIQKGQAQLGYHDLPNPIKESLSLEMEKANPIAHISMLLNCPNCSHQWEVIFDIISYLWTEIDHWARLILQEVYILARAFGWTEQEILNLSARRRHFYLQMLKT